MTPQEKLVSLVQKYVDLFKKSDTCFGDCNNTVACQQSWYQCEEWYRHAIQCALISVDEILELIPEMAYGNRYYDYFKEVKQEIEKL
jgi:hypothetical protein